MNDHLDDRGTRARAELNRIVDGAGRALPSADSIRRRAARRRVAHRVMAVSLAVIAGSVGLLVNTGTDEGSTVLANRPPVGAESSALPDVVTADTTTTPGVPATTATTVPTTTVTTVSTTTTTTVPTTTTSTSPGPAGAGQDTTTTTSGDSPKEPPASGVTDPGTGDRWRALSTAPIVARHYHVAVWTGREMVVWGGNSGRWSGGTELADGAAYDPKSDRWRVIAPSPLSAREPAAAVWTGSEMVIWGGIRSSGALADGAAYDPERDTWRMLADSPLSARTQVAAVWTGEQVIIWGGAPLGSVEYFSGGAAYDPVSDGWTVLSAPPELGSGGPGRMQTAVWIGDRLLVWVDPARAGQPWNGSSYDPRSRTWEAIPPAPALVPSAYSSYTESANSCLVWTGRYVIAGTSMNNPGEFGVYDPETGQWRITTSPRFGCGYNRGALWASDRLITWAGHYALAWPPDGGASYDPDGDRWETLSGPNPDAAGHTTVWTGEEMLVWSGFEQPNGVTPEGYGYRPPPW